MAIPYSHSFINAQGVTHAGERYLVPAGKRAIIRDITVFADVITFTRRVLVKDETTSATMFAFSVRSLEEGVGHLDCHIVIDEGHVIAAVTDNGEFDVFVSGYLLSL